jgi:hypothetical protein
MHPRNGDGSAEPGGRAGVALGRLIRLRPACIHGEGELLETPVRA